MHVIIAHYILFRGQGDATGVREVGGHEVVLTNVIYRGFTSGKAPLLFSRRLSSHPPLPLILLILKCGQTVSFRNLCGLSFAR